MDGPMIDDDVCTMDRWVVSEICSRRTGIAWWYCNIYSHFRENKCTCQQSRVQGAVVDVVRRDMVWPWWCRGGVASQTRRPGHTTVVDVVFSSTAPKIHSALEAARSHTYRRSSSHPDLDSDSWLSILIDPDDLRIELWQVDGFCGNDQLSCSGYFDVDGKCCIHAPHIHYYNIHITMRCTPMWIFVLSHHPVGWSLSFRWQT